MRFFDFPKKEIVTNKAINFLLWHWTTKKPISPYHYGIRLLFIQVGYPFREYNLFYYVYIQSFYQSAINDKRFKETYQALETKTVNNEIIVEQVALKLAKISFYKKGQPGKLATKKYNEIKQNIEKNNQ